MAPVPSSPKRRRIKTEQEISLDQEHDDYVPYVPVAQRRQQKLAQFANRGQAQSAAILRAQREEEEREQREDEDREEEKRRDRLRKERTLLEEAQEVMKRKAEEGANSMIPTGDQGYECTFLFRKDSKKTAVEKAEEDDAKILAAIANQRKLASDLELAKGIQYTDSLKTT